MEDFIFYYMRENLLHNFSTILYSGMYIVWIMLATSIFSFFKALEFFAQVTNFFTAWSLKYILQMKTNTWRA